MVRPVAGSEPKAKSRPSSHKKKWMRREYTRRAHDAGGMHGRNLTSALMRSRVPNRTRDRGGKPIQLGDSSHEHGPRSGA